MATVSRRCGSRAGVRGEAREGCMGEAREGCRGEVSEGCMGVRLRIIGVVLRVGCRAGSMECRGS